MKMKSKKYKYYIVQYPNYHHYILFRRDENYNYSTCDPTSRNIKWYAWTDEVDDLIEIPSLEAFEFINTGRIQSIDNSMSVPNG